MEREAKCSAFILMGEHPVLTEMGYLAIPITSEIKLYYNPAVVEPIIEGAIFGLSFKKGKGSLDGI